MIEHQRFRDFDYGTNDFHDFDDSQTEDATSSVKDTTRAATQEHLKSTVKVNNLGSAQTSAPKLSGIKLPRPPTPPNSSRTSISDSGTKSMTGGSVDLLADVFGDNTPVTVMPKSQTITFGAEPFGDFAQFDEKYCFHINHFRLYI